jgi:hypothetical protein
MRQEVIALIICEYIACRTRILVAHMSDAYYHIDKLDHIYIHVDTCKCR